MFLYIIISIIVVVITYIYVKSKLSFSYWKRRGVKGPEPIVGFGNFKDVVLLKKTFGECSRDFHRQLKDEKVIGIYQSFKPLLLIVDEAIAKKILIKDFDHFTDRGFGFDNDEFNENLFQADGDNWRVLRQRLSPVFTSGKLRNMVYLLEKSSQAFDKYIGHLVDDNADNEIAELMAKFTLDCVGSCVFGIDVDAFCEGENIFRKIGDRLMSVNIRNVLRMLIEKLSPSLFKYFKNMLDDHESIHFFKSLTHDVTQDREGKPKIRHDFMDLMISLKEQTEISGNKINTLSENSLTVTDHLITAQVLIFYVAGFETSSNTMGFLIHELVQNPEIQEKARKEVDEVLKKHNDKMTYEAIQDMQYLEMVMSETLRKYPILDTIFRQCSRDYYLPEIDLNIEKGTSIWVPLLVLHNNPEIYPDPEKFDPERFSPEKRIHIPSCSYMPFGDGPRNCIGLRFAKVMSIMGIATILRNYTISKSDKTLEKIQFKPGSISLKSKTGLWAKFERRSKTDTIKSSP